MTPSRTVPLALLLLIVSSLSMGCHRKFKKFVETADAVELAVTVPGRPSVNLVEDTGAAQTNIGALVKAATEVAGAVESVKLKNRLEGLMTPDSVQELAASGALAELEAAKPFGLAAQESDGLLEITLTSYGIVQQGGGPVFFAEYYTRVYDKNKKRVYSYPTSCSDNEFFVGFRGMRVLNTVTTISYLNELSDEALMEKIDAAIDRCTSEVFSNMRRHAG